MNIAQGNISRNANLIGNMLNRRRFPVAQRLSEKIIPEIKLISIIDRDEAESATIIISPLYGQLDLKTRLTRFNLH